VGSFRRSFGNGRERLNHCENIMELAKELGIYCPT